MAEADLKSVFKRGRKGSFVAKGDLQCSRRADGLVFVVGGRESKGGSARALHGWPKDFGSGRGERNG